MSRILEFGKDMDYTQMSVAPEQTVKKILDAVENNLVYVERFRNSVIYDAAIKAVKEKFIAEICRANNINLKDNYHEVAKVTFLVGGCTDIIMMLSENFNREEVEKIMVNVIKRK